MKCLVCGSEQNLNCHHVSYIPKKCVFLCARCHRLVHCSKEGSDLYYLKPQGNIDRRWLKFLEDFEDRQMMVLPLKLSREKLWECFPVLKDLYKESMMYDEVMRLRESQYKIYQYMRKEIWWHKSHNFSFERYDIW